MYWCAHKCTVVVHKKHLQSLYTYKERQGLLLKPYKVCADLHVYSTQWEYFSCYIISPYKHMAKIIYANHKLHGWLLRIHYVSKFDINI